MRSDRFIAAMGGKLASDRARMRLTLRARKGRRKRRGDPHYGNEETYERHALSAFRKGRLTPVASEESDELRLEKLVTSRMERLREILSVVDQVLTEAIGDKDVVIRSLMELSGGDTRRVSNAFGLYSTIHDLSARLSVVEYAAENLDKDKLTQYLQSSYALLNRLSNEMHGVVS